MNTHTHTRACTISELKNLDEWSALGYAREEVPVLRRGVDYILRLHCNSLNQKQFVERFELTRRPVIIRGLTDSWPAKVNWSFENLCRRYGNVRFKCGEDDDGRTLRVKLKHFIAYAMHQKDDSPLYIFDGSYEERKNMRELSKDYDVPTYFKNSLWKYVDREDRPPDRWFLIGPARSGTTVHKDPLGTSAWNTVLTGRKRWVVFNPKTPKSVVKGTKYLNRGDDDEAVSYFSNILPKIRAENTTREGMEMYEFIQYPGETIFVPGGWWHAVYNMDDTVAVTHNFVDSINFVDVWRKTRTGRFKIARQWLRDLGVDYPGLVKVANDIDRQDGFDFKKEGERRRLKKERKRRERERRKRLKDEQETRRRTEMTSTKTCTKVASDVVSSTTPRNYNQKRSRGVSLDMAASQIALGDEKKSKRSTTPS